MAKKYLINEAMVENNDGGCIYYPSADSTDRLLNDIEESNIMFIAMENEVMFPYLSLSTTLTHPQSISSAVKAFKSKTPVFLFLASDSMPEAPEQTVPEDVVLSRGVVGFVTECQEQPSGFITASFVLGPRAVATNLGRCVPDMRGDVLYAVPERIKDTPENREADSQILNIYKEIAGHLGEDDRKRLMDGFDETIPDSARRFYYMVQNSPLNIDERYKLLEAYSYGEQRELFLDMLKQKKEELAVRAEMHFKTMSEMGMRQREEFLRTQMQQIKNELGETDDSEIDELKKRAEAKEWNDEAAKRFNQEVRKLTRLNPTSADYAVQYAYLDTYLNLPWNHCDNADFSLQDVEDTLNQDHYGMQKVKERIVEQMAVLKLRRDTKSPILCLYGPPGVGKTSLGQSVAKALGRKYVRVALGGLHDEAEIRGHRRTYLGSMPGRIINALEKCGTSDPVMVLDEIDKIGADYKGDPSQALLEVLDPEQNCHFHDNYVDQDYDLSKVLFIATANSLSTLSAPLLDRMELIEIGGYVEAEKVIIAKNHLIPKSLVEHGFAAEEMSFTDEALMTIITDYTRESGVRRLGKKINDVLRKQACLKASGKEFPVLIDRELVRKYLGKAEIFNDTYENNDITGVVTGLAWTSAGGEILFIESSTSPGKDCKLVLTGNLGDVMKESAMLALQYIKANSDSLGISEKDLEVGTVHVHVPEGAVPKDGPSAGITIVTSLASTFTGRKVRERLAMTGEITLRGKVLPVGGIKEKILAAKRSGITTIMLCEKNRKDIEEINPEYIDGLEFHYVDNVRDALDFALM